MKRRIDLAALTSAALLLAVLLPMSSSSQAQPANREMCFPETKLCIGWEYRDYWVKNGGLPVFGYPITQSWLRADKSTSASYTVQWFERNRLEYHRQNKPPYDVLLGRIGYEMLKQSGRDPGAFPKADPSVPYYFKETGHAIADVFWTYWKDHGLDLGDRGISDRESIALFGYPVSEAQMETSNGKQLLTQWFERARFEYHPDNPDPHKVLLGLLGNEIKPLSPQRALDRANYYRTLAGLRPLALHPAIQAASQNHANYQQLNHFDSSAWEFGGHGEVTGKPGYTGKWPSDRIKAAGYPWWGGAEVAHGIGDPIQAVDGWMVSLGHRVIVLTPQARHTGYGYGSHYATDPQGNRVQVSVDVMVFGDGPPEETPPGTPYPIAYPVDGQTDVPTDWGGKEGYPFSLQGAYGELRVQAIEMRDSSGQAVSVKQPYCTEFNCYDLVSTAPLKPNTTYSVRASGTVGNVAFDRTWRFTTGRWSGVLP